MNYKMTQEVLNSCEAALTSIAFGAGVAVKTIRVHTAVPCVLAIKAQDRRKVLR